MGIVSLYWKKRPVDPWSIFGRHSVSDGRDLRKTQMPECRPTVDRHNNLSADGRTMIECCLTYYLTTTSTEEIGHRLKNYNLTRRTQKLVGRQKKKKSNSDNGWWTADCRLKNPIFASNTIGRWICDWGIIGQGPVCSKIHSRRQRASKPLEDFSKARKSLFTVVCLKFTGYLCFTCHFLQNRLYFIFQSKKSDRCEEKNTFYFIVCVNWLSYTITYKDLIYFFLLFVHY